MEKYFCTELLIGKEKLQKLRSSFATIVGVGAVGSYTAEALARSGVGRIRLVDFDKIKPSNFNRHLCAIEPNLGKPKVLAAKERIAMIHPDCRVEALEMFAADETFDQILGEKPDLLIDAIDSVTPKAQLLAACYERKIPVISSMGAAIRMDIFSVKAGDLFKTTGCPLARELRGKLRERGIERGIFCVYSDTPVSKEPEAVPGLLNSEDDYSRGRKRRKMGSLPTVPGVFGLIIAHHAIQYLIGDISLNLFAGKFLKA